MTPVTRRQCEITAGRVSDYGHAIRIDLKQSRPLLVNPTVRVLDVAEDIRQTGFGRQAVINGDNREACFDIPYELGGVHPAALAHGQRATVNPSHAGKGLL